MAEPPAELVRTFRFEISLVRSAGPGATSTQDKLGDGGFSECSGLGIDVDVQEYFEGGRNDGVIRRVGRGKFQNIVLKRGMFYAPEAKRANADLWKWVQDVIGGVRPVARYDGGISVRSADWTGVVAEWSFVRGLPARIVGPTLNAQSGEVAIEELHIAHEGLRLKARS